MTSFRAVSAVSFTTVFENESGVGMIEEKMQYITAMNGLLHFYYYFSPPLDEIM